MGDWGVVTKLIERKWYWGVVTKLIERKWYTKNNLSFFILSWRSFTVCGYYGLEPVIPSFTFWCRDYGSFTGHPKHNSAICMIQVYNSLLRQQLQTSFNRSSCLYQFSAFSVY
jgi:hypothetical protein